MFPNTTTQTSPNGLIVSIVENFSDVIHTQEVNMAKGGRGGAGRGTKPGRGNKSRKSVDAGVPKRSGELGACKDLEDKMFILSVSNKAKDGDVFRKTLEAVITYVGSHYGEHVAKELQNRFKTTLPLPVINASIEVKWRAKVAVHNRIVQDKVTSLTLLVTTIEAAIAVTPGDMILAEKLIDITEKKSKADQELLEEPEIESVMTIDEKYTHSNAHRTHRENNHKLIENRAKIYSLLIGQCTVPLKDKMKEDADWLDIADKYDHIRLVQLIEKTVLKQTESKNPYQRVQDEMRAMLNFQQAVGMNNNDYYEKTANRVEITLNAGGVFYTPMLLDLESQEKYSSDYEDLTSDTEKFEVRRITQDKYLATLYLMRSESANDQLKDSVKNDYSKGIVGAYPSTIPNAMMRMNEFRPVKIDKPMPPALGTAFAGAGGNKSQGKKKTGRLSAEEWNALSDADKAKLKKEREDAKAAKVAADKKPSKSKDDDDKSTSGESVTSLKKELTALKRVNKSLKKTAFTLINEGNESDLSDDEDGSNNFLAGMSMMCEASPRFAKWQGQQFASAKKKSVFLNLNLSEEILLDSETTHVLFCNPKLVNNIRDSPQALRLSGNGGMMRVTQKADLPGLYPTHIKPAETWFSEKAITNLISFKCLNKIYRITYDSKEDKAFVVHRGDYGMMDLRFVEHESGLHIMERLDGKTSGSTFVQTVKENMKLFTSRQIKGASKARELYELLQCPSEPDFDMTLRTNAIKGCKVTLEDAQIMWKIWGPSVIKMKGNDTRQITIRKQSNIVAVPREFLSAQKSITLSVDFFFINKYVFLMTVSKHVCFTTTSHCSTRAVRHYWKFLKEVLMMYYRRGLRVTIVRGDLEFKPLERLLQELPRVPALDLAAKEEHVGDIERNTRYLKEKCRQLRHALPFEQIPGVIIVRMVQVCTTTLNMFPRRGGSTHYSPSMIVTNQGVSMDQLRIRFGSYVQVWEPSTQTNSMKPRSRGAIALGPSPTSTTGYVFMALDTGKIIIRSQFKEIPMTESVIARVNQLGSTEPIMLTWTNRRGENIGDGPLWDAMPTSGNTNIPSTIAEAIEEDDEDVTLAEADLDDQTTDLDVVDNITGVDNTQDVYEQWDEVVQDTEGSDVIDHTVNQDEVPVVAESSPGGVTSNLDESPRVSPTVPTTGRETPFVSPTSRPTRERKPPSSFIPSMKGNKYGYAMTQILEMDGNTVEESVAFMQRELHEDGEHHRPDVIGRIMVQLSMKAAEKEFGKIRTDKACRLEVKQIHMRNSFVPKHWEELTPKQKNNILESFIFVEEKKSGADKGRLVINGAMQRGHITKEEASSPTVFAESVILTSVVDAKEGRTVATVDIPNAFVQTVITDAEKDYRVIVRLRGRLLDLLLEIAPNVYGPYVHKNKKGDKVLLVQCMNALYGTMVASLLFYKKFVTSLKNKGFVLNPYDSCVANKTVDGKVLTVCFHVDDNKISHVSSKVVDATIEWLRKEYEVIFYDGSGAMKVRRGKIHEYLGMLMDFTTKGEVHITMLKHLDDVVETFEKAQAIYNKGFKEVKRKRSASQLTAAPKDLFVINDECEKLPKEQREQFHQVVAKAIYLWKHGRPDIGTPVSFLTKRVREPDLDDWRKLDHMIVHLKADRLRKWKLGADDSKDLVWYVDSAFGVHDNYRSHTGGGLTMGKGFAISVSRAQKMNTRSSTEAEIVAVDDCLSLILWAREFMIEQGYGCNRNIILQDNMSSVLLENNGKASSGKRTRHMNIKYFGITDRVDKEEAEIMWISREDMVADYLTKATQGAEFRRFRDFIMGSA